MNPWLNQRVFHWAHQGGAREGPSNTIRAMRRAIRNGAHGLELDVHKTHDHVLVVSHDRSLCRMTGQDGLIATLDFADLERYDAAARWVPGKVDAQELHEGEAYGRAGSGIDDPELRIPSLDAVLAKFPGVPLCLEIKAKGCERALARCLAEHRRTDDVIVVSFDDLKILRFKHHAPNICTAPGRIQVVVSWIASRLGLPVPRLGHSALQVPDRFGPFLVTDSRLVAAAHRRGMAVHAWTVDDPDRMHALIDADVDGIMTDRPSVLRQVLAERPVGWHR